MAGNGFKWRNNPAQLEEVRQKYEAGASARQIADGMGLTATQVEYAIRQYGFKAGSAPTVCPKPIIEGVTADDRIPDPAAVWEKAIQSQKAIRRKVAKREMQKVSFSPGCGPVGLVFLSDLHFGGDGVDYAALKRDAELVRDTDGLFAVYLGDGLNNWIIGNLMALQRSEILTHKEALALHEDWLRTLAPKLICCVAGNHDTWSQALSGLSYLRECVRDLPCLYDDDEAVFTLSVGKVHKLVKVRHKWRGSSIYNATHAIERDARFGDHPFDIGVAGHVHTGWYARPFHVHNRQCLAVQVGAYKLEDSFARKQGFPACKHRGSGAVIVDEMGVIVSLEELEEAAEYMAYRRAAP